MKRFILTLFAVIALVSVARSQNSQTIVGSGSATPAYGVQALTTSSLLPLAGSSATNLNATIDGRFQSSVGVFISQKNDSAGTANVGYFFQRSPDNSTWDTTGFIVNVAANGTTTVNTFTNIPMYGMGYLRLAYVTNAAGSGNCTNIEVSYAVKRMAP